MCLYMVKAVSVCMMAIKEICLILNINFFIDIYKSSLWKNQIGSFESVCFWKGGKNLSKQRSVPSTNSNHLWCRGWDLNLSTLVGVECSHYCNTLASISPPVIAFTKQSRRQFDTALILVSHVQPRP